MLRLVTADPSRIDVDALAALVVGALRDRAEELDLSPAGLSARYVLNWGGFVNQSFRIDDGRRELHLKLTANPGTHAGLARWYRVHADLTAKYHAPPVIGWVTIPATGHQGLLFPHLDGTTLDEWRPELRGELVAVVKALHRDVDLRERAFPGETPGTCAAGYQDDFHRRFTEDLASIAADRPTFVGEGDLAWMTAEVGRLFDRVARSAAFTESADALIHGDLWTNNVLVAPTGEWHLLDWDDLRLGDPVLDLAKLLEDGTGSGPPPTAAEIDDAIGKDPAGRERLELYHRAILLDWIIDPLADYLEVGQAPEHAERVRAAKARQHVEARARYRDRYR